MKALIALITSLILVVGPLSFLAQAEEKNPFIDEQPCVDAKCQQQQSACTDSQCLKNRREKAKEECEAEVEEETQTTEPGTTPGGEIDSVPVHEVGELLTVTKDIKKLTENIKKLTGEQKDLQIQICTHLKVIRDMQLAMEEKEFKFDPDAAAARAQAIHNHKLAVVQQLAGASYDVSPALTDGQTGGQQQNKQPLQPLNWAGHLQDTRKEAGGVLIDKLENETKDQMLFNQEVTGVIKEQEAKADNFTEAIKPTGGWSKEKYEQFAKAKPEEFTFENLVLAMQPQNNPYGVYLLTQQELIRRKAESQQLALEELKTAGGILPTRTCDDDEKTADGKYCKKWKTQITGSILKDYIVAVLTSLLRQIESSDESLEDKFKAELEKLTEDLKTKDLTELGQESVFDESEQDICPDGGPGPCKNSGWESEQDKRPKPPAGGPTGGPPDFNGREFQNNLNQGINGGFTNVPGNLPAEVRNNINQDIRTGLPDALRGIDFINFDDYQQSQFQQTLDGFLGNVLQREGVNEEQRQFLQPKLWLIILNLILSLIGKR